MLRDRFLRKVTGYDSKYWVDQVQAAIWRSVIPETGDVHPDCDMDKWIMEIVRPITKAIEDDQESESYDGNIRAAYAVGLVLITWASRIHHAKCYDPNRPLALRRNSLKSHSRMQLTIFEAITDESHDTRYFDQEYSPPYGKGARGGNFV